MVAYPLDGVSPDMSFLEILDTLNEQLIRKGEEPVAFDHDCREGICGSCDMMINGTAHGPERGTTTCQLHMRSFADGADIYIEKSSGASEIGNAIRALLNADGGFEELTPADSKLSRRQKQLIVMLDRGLSNREIAEELGISEHTVKVHLWRLFRRLGVKSRTQTIHFARTHGMLTS